MPVGPPRNPRPAAGAALELPTDTDPQAYPVETDAVGESRDHESDDSGGTAAL